MEGKCEPYIVFPMFLNNTSGYWVYKRQYNVRLVFIIKAGFSLKNFLSKNAKYKDKNILKYFPTLPGLMGFSKRKMKFLLHRKNHKGGVTKYESGSLSKKKPLLCYCFVVIVFVLIK